MLSAFVQSGMITRSSAGWNVKSDDSSDHIGSEDEIEDGPETDESKVTAIKPVDRSVSASQLLDPE